MDQLVQAFHREHQRLYTYDLPNAPVELVNLRVTALGVLPKLDTQGLDVSPGRLEDALSEVRQVYFDQLTGFADTPCYARQRLGPERRFDGPAIVDQDDTTTLVYPSFHARIDTAGNLILERWL